MRNYENNNQNRNNNDNKSEGNNNYDFFNQSELILCNMIKKSQLHVYMLILQVMVVK